MIAGSVAALWQAQFPDHDAADRRLGEYLDGQFRELDANDLLYQIAASRDWAAVWEDHQRDLPEQSAAPGAR